MNGITEGNYNFLCNIGVPYWGNVKGKGQAISVPILNYSSKPISGNIGNGKTFMSHNYISAVVPEKEESNAELEKKMKDFLVKRGIYNGESPSKPIQIKNPSSLKVQIMGDSTTVTYNHPPFNLKATNRTVDIINIMESNESGESTFHGGVIDLRKIKNLEYAHTNSTKTLNASRKIRSVSSAAFTVEQLLQPSVEAMKNNPKALEKYPTWLEKKLFNFSIFKTSSKMVSPQLLNGISTGLRYLGNGLGITGLVLTGYDISQNGLNRNNGTHFVMAVFAIVPYTRVVSMSYFMSNFLVNLATDKNIEDYYIGYEEGIRKAMEPNLYPSSGRWTTDNPYSPYQAY